MEEKNAYYEKLLEQVRINRELNNELEKYKKLYSISKEYMRYKKNFNEFKKEYENLFFSFKNYYEQTSKIVDEFEKRILLNPNFSNIKLSLEEKTNLINLLRPILIKLKSIKLPKQIDLSIEDNSKNSMFQGKERSNKKFIVVKKGE